MIEGCIVPCEDCGSDPEYYVQARLFRGRPVLRGIVICDTCEPDSENVGILPNVFVFTTQDALNSEELAELRFQAIRQWNKSQQRKNQNEVPRQ